MKMVKENMSADDVVHYFINVLSIDGKQEKISNDFTNARFNSSHNCKVLYEDYQKNQISFVKTSMVEGKLEKFVVYCESKSEFLTILNAIKDIEKYVIPLENLVLALESLKEEYISALKAFYLQERRGTFSKKFIIINNHYFDFRDYKLIKNINDLFYILKNKKIKSLSKIDFIENLKSIISVIQKADFYYNKRNILDEEFNYIGTLSNNKGIFLKEKNIFLYNENSKLKCIEFYDTITNFTRIDVQIVKNNNITLYIYKRTEKDFGVFTINKNKINLLQIYSIENINLEGISSLKLSEKNILKIKYKTSIFDSVEFNVLFKIENNSLFFLGKYSSFEIILAYEKNGQTIIENSDFSELYLKDDEKGIFINLKTEEIYNNKIKSKLINNFNLNILKTVDYKFEDLLDEPFAEKYKFQLNNGIVLNSPSLRKYIYINYKTNEIFELINLLDNKRVFDLLLRKYSDIVVENFLPRVASSYPFTTFILTVYKADKHIDWYRSKITKHYLQEYLNS